MVVTQAQIQAPLKLIHPQAVVQYLRLACTGSGLAQARKACLRPPSTRSVKTPPRALRPPLTS